MLVGREHRDHMRGHHLPILNKRPGVMRMRVEKLTRGERIGGPHGGCIVGKRGLLLLVRHGMGLAWIHLLLNMPVAYRVRGVDWDSSLWQRRIGPISAPTGCGGNGMSLGMGISLCLVFCSTCPHNRPMLSLSFPRRTSHFLLAGLLRGHCCESCWVGRGIRKRVGPFKLPDVGTWIAPRGGWLSIPPNAIGSVPQPLAPLSFARFSALVRRIVLVFRNDLIGLVGHK